MNKIAFWVQTVLLVVIYISVMSDDWCRFYLYRGHAWSIKIFVHYKFDESIDIQKQNKFRKEFKN